MSTVPGSDAPTEARVEIASDFPIFGTALTLLRADSSQVFHWTQPPSPIRFALRTDEGYATGELALWADGSFIRGYMMISGLDGVAWEVPEFSLVNGELEDGYGSGLPLRFFDDPFLDKEVNHVNGTRTNFSFESNLVSKVNGSNCSGMPSDFLKSATYELTRTSRQFTVRESQSNTIDLRLNRARIVSICIMGGNHENLTIIQFHYTAIPYT